MLMVDKLQLEEVVYVSWEESERGWGTRPDGISLHLTKEDFKVFLEKYWDRMPKEVPDEYSRPAGEPGIVYASPDLYKKIQEGDHGLRLWGYEETELVSKKKLVHGKRRSGWAPLSKE